MPGHFSDTKLYFFLFAFKSRPRMLVINYIVCYPDVGVQVLTNHNSLFSILDLPRLRYHTASWKTKLFSLLSIL
jgi:hypothetical protein